MFAGYILNDLNQSHYIRKGSEMGAKFFYHMVNDVEEIIAAFVAMPKHGKYRSQRTQHRK